MSQLVSVICVYNKTDVFNNTLKKSLDEQNISVELIAVDNTKKIFSSAAAALNYGASKSNGSILIFVHQDVIFETPTTLSKLIEIFKNCAGAGDIGGVVGTAFNESGTPRIIAGSKVNFLGEKVGNKGFQHEFSEVESIDEFIIIMHKEAFKRHPFDEKVCNGWHFYVIEQCLNAKVHKHKVFVINTDVHHLSPGKVDSSFYWTQYKIARKYQNIDQVVGTCCNFRTRPLYKLWIPAARITVKQVFAK